MMKILTHKKLITVVCFSVLFLGCIEEENHKIELPIDTSEEAIEYAKTDPTVKEWIEKNSDNYIEQNATMNNQSIWNVQFRANLAPIMYYSYLSVEIHSNGSILLKGEYISI